MAKVANGVETLPKISIAWVGCTNVTDDRRQTTDGRTTTYSEHEHEFTFAKNFNHFARVKRKKMSNVRYAAQNQTKNNDK